MGTTQPLSNKKKINFRPNNKNKNKMVSLMVSFRNPKSLPTRRFHQLSTAIKLALGSSARFSRRLVSNFCNVLRISQVKIRIINIVIISR